MRKSLGNYFQILGYWWLLMIIPIALDIIGIYQSITGWQITNIPLWLFSTIGFILTLIIPFVAFHKVRVERDKKQEIIAELEDKKPYISVDTLPTGEYTYLNVTNNGEKGDFWVQISLIMHLDRRGKPIFNNISAPAYEGVWQYNNKEQEIPHNHTKAIKIAYIKLENENQILQLLHYDEITKSAKPIFWRSWTPPISADSYIPKPEYIIQVNISSSPSMKGENFIQNYKVTLDNIEETETKIIKSYIDG